MNPAGTGDLTRGSVVIGMGANIGQQADVVQIFHAAVLRLTSTSGWQLQRAASLYFGPAVGTTGPMMERTSERLAAGPGYFNTAILLSIPMLIDPVDLIAHVLGVEQSLGRVRSALDRYAPRTIDLDVLWWNGQDALWPGPPALQVPHPRLLQRRFAVEPCIELLGAHAPVIGADADPRQPTFGDALIQCAAQPLEMHGRWFTRV